LSRKIKRDFVRLVYGFKHGPVMGDMVTDAVLGLKPPPTMSSEIGTLTESVEVGTIRKVRIRILPFLFLVYIICFLDRINIGFAALTMNKELAITSQQFGLLAGIFFFGYLLFGVPSNLLLHKVGARIWIACILITWGIVAMLTGFAHNVHQLYVVRFLLGLAEAGYYPGIDRRGKRMRS
jgi:ACS family tartrate transporter-like MFS transporter